MIVAGQPDGAPSWFPCNDQPGDKASYRIAVTTESRVHRGRATGGSVTGDAAPAAPPGSTSSPSRWRPTWRPCRSAGTSRPSSPRSAVPQRPSCPPRLRARRVSTTSAGSREMMDVFSELFGPYPFAGYTVVVTDDELEIPLEAQGMSIFGANHLDGRRGSERLVAHELAHQWFGNSLTVGRWRDIWLHEGFACYAEWLWSERPAAGRPTAAPRGRMDAAGALPQDLRARRPGAGADVRRPALQARRADAARAAPAARRRRFFDLVRGWTAAHRHGVGQHARCSWRTSRNWLVRRRPRHSSAGSTSRAAALPPASGRRAASRRHGAA